MKFVSPKSFTGEDLIEINCHGNLIIVNKIKVSWAILFFITWDVYSNKRQVVNVLIKTIEFI